LGCVSPTEDIEGEVRPLADAPIPDRAALLAAIDRLQGTILQRPPAFSALKVGGRRAYALARAGHDVALAPRPVHIHRLELQEYAYPDLQIEVECSAGTYIRSLGRDLAESLGTGAVMSALVRAAIGPFLIERSLPVAELSAATIAAALDDPTLAVGHLPRVTLSDSEREEVVHGRTIADPLAGQHAELAAVDAQGRLVALLAPSGEGTLRPTRCFTR
jgi:tRNA pseudouridine55 synthase